MSKTAVVKVSKFSAIEIAQAVSAVSLPAALQGVEVWENSRAIGGNSAAHLAAANGKAQAIGLCQMFGDFWFGAESRANLVKGLVNSRVRKAFDLATQDVIRLHGKPLEAARVLAFLQEFTRHAMQAEMVKPVTEKVEAKAEEVAQADNVEARVVVTIKAEELAQAEELAKLKAELAMLREFKAAVMQAKSIKEVRAIAA